MKVKENRGKSDFKYYCNILMKLTEQYSLSSSILRTYASRARRGT